MLVLPEAWLRRWKGEDPFDRLMALEGEVYKLKTDHRTVRFTFEGKSYFAKLHRGAGWKEILGQLLKLRRPVLGAQTEWRAIQRLEKLGIPTTPLVGYGKRGWHPARLESFVITEELTDRVSLEDLGREWQASPPRPAFRRAVIGEVARIARVLHENGLNHRDFYLCHFLTRRPAEENRLDPATRRASGLLHLIDLHRVQVRRRTPLRWRVKDLAALCSSAAGLPLHHSDIFQFMREYRQKPLRATLAEDTVLWRRVATRARAFRKEYLRKYAG